MNKQDNFILLIVGLAIYNIFYGAILWIIAGFNGLIIGSIIMLVGGIVGGLMKVERK